MDIYLGDNEAAAIQTVQTLLPDNTDYAVVGHGQDNLIVLAGDEVYRFPRSKAVWERAGVEHFVLERLKEHPELPVPVLKHVHENPAYTIAVALNGEVLENQTIRNLPKETQQYIGEQIGTFAAQFHGLFTPEEIRPFLAEKHPQAQYNDYLASVLPRTPEPYRALAMQLLHEWPTHDHSETLVIHDDLHTHNMLFDPDYALTGVLDFGDVNLGNAEQDLRYTYWMSDTVMNSALAVYETVSGRTIDHGLVALCAMSQELSGLGDPARAYMHARARRNLSFRHPELNV